MDAGNMLKPMLARGELHCVGATTLSEYRTIEKDAALERRFQPVVVDEPSPEDTISILRGLRERFEVHHGVKIQDAALVAAATLSTRYISDRFLPDKAIDLVDEACAVIRTEIDSMPAELDEITRRATRLEIEETALRKEDDPASKKRLEILRKELAELRSQADAMTAQWEAERQAIRRLQALREELEQLRREIEQAERAYDLNRAAELRHGRLPELERRLRAEEERLADKQSASRLLARGGHRGRDRRRRRALDGHPGQPPAGDRARQAAAPRRGAARARHRPGRGGAPRRRRGHPRAGGDQGSAPPDRLVHLPRPDRRRQDGALQGARRVAVRLRGVDRAPGHVRVPGAPHRLAPDGRSSRLRRLRGGRPADRGRASQALRGRPLRRDREGPPRGLQRAVADTGRRAPDRCAGADGEFP